MQTLCGGKGPEKANNLLNPLTKLQMKFSMISRYKAPGVTSLLDAEQMNVIMVTDMVEAKPAKPNGQRQCQELLRNQKKEFKN